MLLIGAFGWCKICGLIGQYLSIPITCEMLTDGGQTDQFRKTS